MFISNDINLKTNLGFKKYIPNFDWSLTTTNANNIINSRTPEEELSIIEKYLNTNIITRDVRNTQRFYVNYYYLTRYSFTDDILAEIRALIDDMNSNGDCDNRYGNDRLRNTSNWSGLCPILTSHPSRDLRLSIFEVLRSKVITFIYVNTEIPDVLIELYKTASNTSNSYIKLDDNTHLITCNTNSSKLCIFSGEYSIESLTKHIMKVLDVDDNMYDDKFCTDIITQNNPDTLDKQIKDFINEGSLGASINKLIRYDSQIEEALNNYNRLLNTRLSYINELKHSLTEVQDVTNFVKTIEKLGDDFQVQFFKGSMFNKPFIRVKCTTPLFNYDEGVIKRMINNNYLKNYTKSENSWVNKLFEDCFVKNTRQFMTSTYIKIYNNPSSFCRDEMYNDVCVYTYGEIIPKMTSNSLKYIGNPHIIRFNCWGQNGPVLEGLLKDKKWEEMLYCIKATLGNINFNDSTVLQWFCNLIRNAPDSYPICRDTETGKDITVKELKDEWSKQNEEN